MNIRIIGNGTFVDCSDALKKSDVVIAADGGANHCLRMGVTPDLIVGDGDSISPEAIQRFANVERLEDRNQDFSDLQKSLHVVRERFTGQGKELTRVDLHCFISLDRFDHSLVAFVLMREYADLPLRLHGTEWSAEYVHGKRVLHGLAGKTVSLIPIGDYSDVTTEGFAWEVNDAILAERTVSLSNRIISDKCTVTVKSGGLMLILN